MLILVVRVLEDAEEDEPGRDRSVEHAEEDYGGNHEGEGQLLEQRLKRAKSRGGHVLISDVDVDDRADDAEQDNLGDGARPERLGKVTRVFHFSDKGREGDLADKSVADVEEGTKAVDEGGANHGDSRHDGVAADACRTVGLGVARAQIEARRVRLDGGKDGGQEDRDEGEESGGGAEPGQHVKGPRERAHPANDGHNDPEADSAAYHIVGLGHGVEILCAHKDVQALDELWTRIMLVLCRKRKQKKKGGGERNSHRIVEDEHGSGYPPRPSLVPKQHLANVADIADFWMA